ncbi:polyketide synthase (plasmid) [Streptomyces clavuligerus]|uniref:Polyketide synthase n=1 Tax=Streptomyces clavuligerus TaxID=1901 RepID=B5GS30_STRCL|nr:modular polyketide synthase [Streptomyces clavuligerus]EFG03823.1 Polyketide synthase [Streptomyces clavuligerus]MBY6307654.1 polyketide synthase [Streptomyces clavuligerus]QCS09796.1 polyketide synthase [Streptomyces clavuligerus]QPJ98161.1 polyketide synthase [Streptomyces clavuligerus]
MTRAAGPDGLTRHTAPGVHRGAIANRLSHVLGASGPSLVVDTGQFSSLVAVHLACASLRGGECDTTLAAGVNLLLGPDNSRLLAEWGDLSPDGVCRTFDARADGFVRGEGAAAPLLKPLSSAIGDGDTVLAVILGSAVNRGGDDPSPRPAPKRSAPFSAVPAGRPGSVPVTSSTSSSTAPVPRSVTPPRPPRSAPNWVRREAPTPRWWWAR